jgi:ribosomal protein S18 acetylase RimI-like enzyme
MIAYRPMKPGDIPAGLSLCRAYGWNQLARDWELFLQLNPGGCCVGVDQEGKVVGTVTTLRYENHFSWIGMVLVDPARQRQGIGGHLLEESLRILMDEKVVKLDATPAGRGVYLKLNFVDEYRLSRMHSESPARLPPSGARPLHRTDFPQLLALDREIFGADRKAVLEWVWAGAPQYAFVIEERSQIKGYCFGRPGHRFTHIGPVIAPDHGRAIQLMSAALRNCTGPTIVDALQDKEDWVRWLSSLGFVEQRQLIRMYRGSNAGPGVPEKQFAILGPELG